MRRELAQALRFAAVGGSGVAVNLGAFATAGAAGVPVLGASVPAFLAACLWNVRLHERLTFRHPTAPVPLRSLRYIALSTATLGANLFTLDALLAAGAALLAAQLAGIAVACPLNYAGSRALVFRRAGEPAAAAPPGAVAT